MDAKPHRPVRAFGFRDENFAPSALPSKTLHQRNKSSPALSTLAKTSAAAAKVPPPAAGAKRTAFADLSNNTSRFTQLSKDDGAIAVKSTLESVKEDELQQFRTAAPMLRPAQRPLSVSGIKGFFNSLTSNVAAQSTLKTTQPPLHQLHSTQPQAPQAQRKTIAKKSTMVFRESDFTSLSSSSDPISSTTPQDNIEYPPAQPSEETSQPDVNATIDPRLLMACSEVVQTHPVYSVAPKSLSASESFALAQKIPLPPDPAFVADDLVQEMSRTTLQTEAVSEPVEVYQDALDHQQAPSVQAPLVQAADSVQAARPEAPPQIPIQRESVDYYEEDGYDVIYEDDGLTGEHSLLTKGGYTTGPTTIVIAPRMTSQAKREIAAARAIVAESKELLDLEEDETWDTSMVAEYGNEIFEYLHKLEDQMRPNPFYMENQTEIQWSMRSVLMDWLVQVHHRFSLLPETLFLCVNYIDRFLSCKVVSLGKLQLVGATAIFVAAKYEEINCPSVQEIVYMVDGGYTVDEILKAERFMLSMLQFELGWPGPMSFLRRISKADDYDLETRTLAKYFLEITIMDERFVGCIPSFAAAGAHCLSRFMLQKGDWSARHIHYSEYTYGQLRPLLQAMLSCCEEPKKHHGAIFDKYSDKRFKRASHFVQAELAKGFKLPVVGRLSIPVASDYPIDWKAKPQISQT